MSTLMAGMDEKSYKKAMRKHLKIKRQPPQHEWTPFRAAEKRFKAKFPPPDLSDVLDLSQIDHEGEIMLPSKETYGSIDLRYTKTIRLNHQESRRGGAYAISRIPGLVILPGFLTHEEQRSLIRWSLCDQARSPNESNLDIHYQLPKEGIWNIHVKARLDVNGSSSKYIIEPKRPTGPEPPEYPPEGPRPLIDNAPINPTELDEVYLQPKPTPSPSLHLPPVHASKLLSKLRWANIGYYYHWGSKAYDFTKPKTEYPEDVRNICKEVVSSINWQQVWEGVNDEDWGEHGPDWETWPDTYGIVAKDQIYPICITYMSESDAGIVNFYQLKDTLCGHVDRSEVCATSPLVSISLGNAAIFLIGGLTRSQEPVPILLRSGDIIVMSGPGCRRAYHGVPRILESTLPTHLQAGNEDRDWEPFADYLRSTRINVNVRQVFPRGFDPFAKKKEMP